MTELFDIHKKMLKPKTDGNGFKPNALGKNDIEKFFKFLETPDGKNAIQTHLPGCIKYTAPPGRQWFISNGIKGGNNSETLPIASFEWTDEPLPLLLLYWSPEAKPRGLTEPKQRSKKLQKTMKKKRAAKNGWSDSDSDDDEDQSDDSRAAREKKSRGRPKKKAAEHMSMHISSDDEEPMPRVSDILYSGGNSNGGGERKTLRGPEKDAIPSFGNSLLDLEDLGAQEATEEPGFEEIMEAEDFQPIPARFKDFTPEQYIAKILQLEEQLAAANQGTVLEVQEQPGEVKLGEPNKEVKNCLVAAKSGNGHDVLTGSGRNDGPAEGTEDQTGDLRCKRKRQHSEDDVLKEEEEKQEEQKSFSELKNEREWLVQELQKRNEMDEGRERKYQELEEENESLKKEKAILEEDKIISEKERATLLEDKKALVEERETLELNLAKMEKNHSAVLENLDKIKEDRFHASAEANEAMASNKEYKKLCEKQRNDIALLGDPTAVRNQIQQELQVAQNGILEKKDEEIKSQAEQIQKLEADLSKIKEDYATVNSINTTMKFRLSNLRH